MTIETPHVHVPAFHVGDRLRKAREEAGLSQQDLAADLGIARQSVSNYESGRFRPRRPVMLAWAMRTKVPLEWLMTGVAGPGPSPDGATDSQSCVSRSTHGDLIRLGHAPKASRVTLFATAA
jgi:transcriptional regulator with XRE-family HTH domain